MRWLVAMSGLLLASLAPAQEARLLEPIAPRRSTDPDGDGQLPPRAARLKWKSEVSAAAREVVAAAAGAGGVIQAQATEAYRESGVRGAERLENARDAIERDALDLKDHALDVARRRLADRDAEVEGDGFTRRVGKLFDFERNDLFSCDDEFESFVSPVTNPFLFEDPRTLTEIRGLGLFQQVPSGQPNFQGGSLWFIGGRGSVAFSKRLSLVVSKFGLSGVGTPSWSNLSDGVGLSELWLGPKFTIIRDVEYGTLLAAGLQLQVPLGSGNVYQNTGDLTLVPYVSAGQQFFKTRLGGFNALGSAGYAFSINDKRSNYFYASGQVSFDVNNTHTFFPLVEMNWFQYTTDGTSRFLAGEGRDLVNFGSLAKGSTLLTAAAGARYRFSKAVEFGGAVELPVLGNRDFFKYRILFDISYRF